MRTEPPNESELLRWVNNDICSLSKRVDILTKSVFRLSLVIVTLGIIVGSIGIVTLFF